ncbi:MAG: ABC transporter permease [Bacteroidetes bacterium]|nr:ABC transporter permease [Bacteroidota bacterium]
MITLIIIELEKIFRKWRTYIGFIAIGILTPIVQIALSYQGEKYVNFATQSLRDSFLLTGNLFNGYLVGYLMLQSLFIHIPFLIVLVGGDLLAGEATTGTYRLLLTRPISRLKILSAKYFAGIIYTVLLLCFLMFMSLVVSVIFFGSGELIVVKGKIIIFASDDVLWRFALAYLYAALSLTTVMGLSFLFSSLVENAIGPIVASMAVIIVFLILSVLPFDLLESIRPFLFTNHMNHWSSFFADKVEYSEILISGSVLLLHIIGFYLIALFLFIKKDILS